ncbi:hypothetical protein DUNSADRAFT_29 [Dunaliella salina]|uniref:HIT-type domain-containing protein n=1 Tax=Dunaliella salina TaxID=3046 RepID=A0ABQ7HAN1_DUNSA|nr:hypothetical protein DUNSADRAFT_29 [Dunaliella salina]|eukprot:KAF5843907.1 hypothetical protein DUNSADRAFT_29 [Dunaliella salina]
MDLEDRKTVCRVCHKQFARYICPRCNISYCGLPCYKQHSERCTEAFYREQAVGQLKGSKADRSEKKKVLRALQRVQLQQEKDEAKVAAFAHAATQQALTGRRGRRRPQPGRPRAAAEPLRLVRLPIAQPCHHFPDVRDSWDSWPLVSPLCRGSCHWPCPPLQAEEAGGDLSQADLEQLLSPSDLRAFKRQLAAGRLAHLVQPWVPWWLTKEAQGVQLSAAGGRLVQEGERAELNEGHGGRQAEAQGMGEESGVLGAERQWEASGVGRQQQQFVQEGVESIQEGHSRPPEPPEEPLHPLSSLTKAKPSPLLQWQAVELLYAYCHVMRQYNGEAVQPEMVAEAVEAVLHLSQALANCMPARGPPGRTSSSAHAGASSAPSTGRAQGPPGPCSQSRPGRLQRSRHHTAAAENMIHTCSASGPGLEETDGSRPQSTTHTAPSPPGDTEATYVPPELAAQVSSFKEGLHP